MLGVGYHIIFGSGLVIPRQEPAALDDGNDSGKYWNLWKQSPIGSCVEVNVGHGDFVGACPIVARSTMSRPSYSAAAITEDRVQLR